jgi:hypothetical protein
VRSEVAIEDRVSLPAISLQEGLADSSEVALVGIVCVSSQFPAPYQMRDVDATE